MHASAHIIGLYDVVALRVRLLTKYWAAHHRASLETKTKLLFTCVSTFLILRFWEGTVKKVLFVCL